MTLALPLTPLLRFSTLPQLPQWKAQQVRFAICLCNHVVIWSRQDGMPCCERSTTAVVLLQTLQLALTLRLGYECERMLHADSEKPDVQDRLETLKDELMQNYVQEQQKLYAELLPEVTYKRPWCFIMLESMHTTMAVSSLLICLSVTVIKPCCYILHSRDVVVLLRALRYNECCVSSHLASQGLKFLQQV